MFAKWPWNHESSEFVLSSKQHGALLLLLALALLTLTPPISAQEKAQGASRYPQFSLFYSYRCLPENRPELRKYMDAAGVVQFEQWKSRGVFKDYIILFSSYVHINSVPWDMLIRIDFDRYADTEKWKEIERTMPAGLPPRILALASPENLNVGETLAAGGMEPTDAAKAIYDVSYYKFKVPLQAGKDFIQGYVVPQLDAFLHEKVLAGYGLYLNKYEGTDWSYLILSEYSDAASFDLRVPNKSKIRSLLDPAWKTLNDIKVEHIRDEPHGFIAEQIVPH
ncbi:MAG TPA: hypothetical protein VNX88_22985 [Terriglobales bacterium]|nr:hypothetical protein [Terriglobales bacterium]